MSLLLLFEVLLESLVMSFAVFLAARRTISTAVIRTAVNRSSNNIMTPPIAPPTKRGSFASFPCCIVSRGSVVCFSSGTVVLVSKPSNY